MVWGKDFGGTFLIVSEQNLLKSLPQRPFPNNSHMFAGKKGEICKLYAKYRNPDSRKISEKGLSYVFNRLNPPFLQFH